MKVLLEGYLANATITARRSSKNNSFASSNLRRLVHEIKTQKSPTLFTGKLQILRHWSEPPKISEKVDEHTTASIKAVDGKTAVPPGT